MQRFTELTATTVALPRADIDTDQIIPARFLTTTTREGLGDGLFADWRFLSDGTPDPEFVLNRPEHASATVLVTERNFGCGSSREHAPWALLDYGFRAVISSEIADIFHSNSLKNGLLPIRVSDDVVKLLLSRPHKVLISVETCTLSILNDAGNTEKTIEFPLDGFSRYCLLEGIDQLGYLQGQSDAITAYANDFADSTNPAL
ncbi:MAG: 3-isopropylmalate dehydratase small subunit [Pseudomonadota bacterium]